MVCTASGYVIAAKDFTKELTKLRVNAGKPVPRQADEVPSIRSVFLWSYCFKMIRNRIDFVDI